MGSLSFENIISSEAEERAEASHRLGAGINGRRSSAPRSERVRGIAASARTYSEASAWALSGTRRALDFIAALTALIVLLPLMLLAAVLVRFGSSGPVFFRQRRMGRNGRQFTLYKFRSMRPAEDSGCCITVVGDTRITAVGAFLRRYKLDELPQFWNVLRGDMGLVGPRPKLPHHEALHMTSRPGITGVATLAFSREEEFLSAIPDHELEAFYEVFVKPAKARLDLEYMRTATFSSDLNVLWRTVCSCLFSAEETNGLPAEMMAKHAEACRVRERNAAAVQHVRPIPEATVRAASLSSEI